MKRECSRTPFSFVSVDEQTTLLKRQRALIAATDITLFIVLSSSFGDIRQPWRSSSFHLQLLFEWPSPFDRSAFAKSSFRFRSSLGWARD